jgi:hypothetical protein
MENRYIINYDIKKKVVGSVTFKQGDIDSSVLEVHLLDRGILVNIVGETIQFRFQKIDNNVVYQDSTTGVTITDGVNGVVECVLKQNTLSVSGLVICEIHRFKDSKELGTPSFTFTVEKSISADGTLSTSEIVSVENLKASQIHMINKQRDSLLWQQLMVSNNLDYIMIESLLDTLNINAVASTDFVYEDYTIKSDNTSTIIWNSLISETTANKAYVIADYELNGGSIAFYISRNNGTTYTLCPENVLTTISTQPTGTSIVLKIVLTGATLNGVAYGISQ